jgi:hypothetical protein
LQCSFSLILCELCLFKRLLAISLCGSHLIEPLPFSRSTRDLRIICRLDELIM